MKIRDFFQKHEQKCLNTSVDFSEKKDGFSKRVLYGHLNVIIGEEMTPTLQHLDS